MEKFIEITPDYVSNNISFFKKGGQIAEQYDLETINPESELSNEDSLNLLIDGNFFKSNSQNILGELKLAKDRFGKAISVVTGTIKNLENLEVSDDFEQFVFKRDIAYSYEEKSPFKKSQEASNESFVLDVIEKSKTAIGTKAVSKVKKNQEVADDFGETISYNLQSAKEIFHKLNPKISKSEIQAYIWYKNQIGQRLSDEWYELSEYNDKKETVQDWINNSILCYFDGELLPQVLYLSGDIYSKISRIVKAGENSGQDIDYIVSNYGTEVLKNQLELINAKYAEIYSKRLIITGNDDDNSLIIKPISKLAREFYITELNDFEKLSWWESKGRPNFEKTDGRSYQKTTFEKLSLTDAFCFYLVNLRNKLEIRGNITYYDIIYFYIDKRTKQVPAYSTLQEEQEFKANLERTKSKAASEGNRLFLKFLAEQLTINDKVRLETIWNSTYNNYLAPDFQKIPVAFNVTREFYGENPFVVKPEKREAVAFLFNEGSGCLTYDVGVGKTMSEIMATEQFLVAGYCKRPVIVVPNKTYKQWISEIKSILPHRKINGLFNLGKNYVDEILDENFEPSMVSENSITVLTYEGFEKLGFNEDTERDLMDSLYEILNQGDQESQMKSKKKAGFREKLETLIGKSLKGTTIPVEDLGFDYLCFDEAHALKKVFTTVKGSVDDKGKRDSKKYYSVESGIPSNVALKGFMISQYILKNNNNRNVVLLTATPFTNSPLEVFSMLSLIAYNQLKTLGINNINDFFDTFIDVNTELIINHKLKPQYKQIVKGFNNLPSLQRIITRFFNYKDGDDVGVIRPNKWVIPYTKKLVDNKIQILPEDEQVTSYIPMNEIQKRYMKDIIAYAEGTNDFIETEDFEDAADTSESDVTDSQSVEVSFTSLTSEEKSGVRAIKAMSYSRNLALSPFLYANHDLGKPTYKTYITTSPKLLYIMECIKSVKDYHIKHNEPISGQVIYMDRGIEYFGLIKEYLVKAIGFKDHEVGMIYSKGMTPDKARMVQDLFLGRKFNEKKQEYEDISDAERIKVLIGSSSIKEGMNLQKKSTVLYNGFIDWNPTDAIQLQGRIWRQQNEFLNVRIVNPLMIDSIDIFMFQKLEEKTARINTIWSNDGKSVLKSEEINPNEIKYALIKDPYIIAQIEIDEKAVTIQDDKKSNELIKERLIKFQEAYNSNESYAKRYFDELINNYAPSKIDLSKDEKFKTLLKLYTSKEVFDENGLIMVSNWEKNYNYKSLLEQYPKGISPKTKPEKPYWFEYYVLNNRLILKELKDLLNPRNIKIDEIEDYIKYLDHESTKLDEELQFLKSENYVTERVKQIIEYREKNKIREKQIPELVTEFERLNYLLSLKRITTNNKPKPFKRLNSDGSVKTDAESLAQLEKFIKTLPQTKELNVDENGEYTPERKKLHNSIIQKVKADSKCIKNEQPIAILTGGSPASGKSTFLKSYAPYLQSKEIYHIDADEVRAMLPEYEGWNATATHLETKDIVNRLLTGDEIENPCLHDLIYDGTMNNTKNYLPLIGLLKSLGYKVFVIYMNNVPYSVVKDRILKRYERTGRYVPMEVIDDFFGKGKAALMELKNKVDGYMIIDAMSKNYDIIEKGGMDLPRDRKYSEIESRTETNAKNEHQEITDAIESLKLMLELVDESEKEEISDAISALEILLLT